MTFSNDIDIKNLINYSDKEVYDLKNINTNIKENIVKYKSLTYLDKIKLKKLLEKNFRNANGDGVKWGSFKKIKLSHFTPSPLALFS